MVGGVGGGGVGGGRGGGVKHDKKAGLPPSKMFEINNLNADENT